MSTKRQQIPLCIFNQTLIKISLQNYEIKSEFKPYLVSFISDILSWKWATPFIIHTPPVEDFEKVYHKGGVNFQMHLPSMRYLEKVYHTGSKYFI